MSGAAIQELQDKIRLYQDRISDLQNELSDLQKKKEALLSVQSAHTRRLSDFYDTHQSQNMTLDSSSKAYTFRYAEGHKRNMESHIANNPHTWTASALDEATRLLKQGITRCAEDIIEARRMIQNFQSEIRYLNERITNIKRLMV